MNWFVKYAQADPYAFDPESRPAPKSYSSIGHYFNRNDDECEEYLWVWHQGKLDYRESTGTSNDIHETHWGPEILHSAYTGRYDDCQNRISIGIPDSLRLREVPEALFRNLGRTFSPDAQMWTFQSSKDPSNPRSGIDRVASCKDTCMIKR